MKKLLVMAALLLLMATHAQESSLVTANDLTRLTFDQHLAAQLSLDAEFVDDTGKAVRLKDCLGPGPAILALGYYECPMLCNLTLNGLVHSLQEIGAETRTDTSVIFISIDPKEAPELAAAKKQTYLKRLGRGASESRWYFLTGRSENIRRVANETGFHYAYDPINRQYAHPSGIVVLTPDGKISKYFFGVSYAATELNTALKAAGAGASGSLTRPFLMLCSKFMALTGKYSGAVMLSVRVLAIVSILGVAGLVIANARRGKRGVP